MPERPVVAYPMAWSVPLAGTSVTIFALGHGRCSSSALPSARRNVVACTPYTSLDGCTKYIPSNEHFLSGEAIFVYDIWRMPLLSIKTIAAGGTSYTDCAPQPLQAHVSEETRKPMSSETPTERGRLPCGSR